MVIGRPEPTGVIEHVVIWRGAFVEPWCKAVDEAQLVEPSEAMTCRGFVVEEHRSELIGCEYAIVTSKRVV